MRRRSREEESCWCLCQRSLVRSGTAGVVILWPEEISHEGWDVGRRKTSGTDYIDGDVVLLYLVSSAGEIVDSETNGFQDPGCGSCEADDLARVQQVRSRSRDRLTAALAPEYSTNDSIG